jgi:hypothetical protein
MTVWAIIKTSPEYNGDDGRYDDRATPVIVLSGSVENVKAFVDNLNDKVQKYVEAIKVNKASIHRKKELMEELLRNPPYEEMVVAVGPKPKYDHSKATYKDYNEQHALTVNAWKQEFIKWTKRNFVVWQKRREEIVNSMIEEVSTETFGERYIDEFDIASSVIVDSFHRYTWSTDRYEYPKFSYVELEMRVL